MITPHPNLRFDIHPVRAKSISWIELFYPCGHTGQILPDTPIRRVTYQGQRPVSFKWHNPRSCKVTPELINWVTEEFIHVFNSNAFIWNISCSTAPKELQCHISGLISS